MDKSKFLNKKNNRNDENELKKFIVSFVSKCLVSIAIFLLLLIISNKNISLKEKINNKVFKNNISFATINSWCKNKLGGILPFDKVVAPDVSVFNEKLTYKEQSLYKDGVKLTVEDNYLVPIIESGIVVFIGEKEEYGQTVIVQQVNGIDVWYSNVDTSNISLYQYLTKGNLLGEAKSNYIYMVFQKDGKFLDYKEYI